MTPETIVGWCIAALAVLTTLMFVGVLLFGVVYIATVIKEAMRDNK